MNTSPAQIVLVVAAWVVAAVLILAASGVHVVPQPLPIWAWHVIASIVCGTATAARIDGRRPYLHGLFIVFALLIPVLGPLLVMVLGSAGSMAQRPHSARDAGQQTRDFVHGIPLRAANRADGEGHASRTPLIARHTGMEPESLSAELQAVAAGVQDAPLGSLRAAFREHPATMVRLTGQALISERLNLLEQHVRELEARYLRSTTDDEDALLGLCELHVAMLGKQLLPPNELPLRCKQGLEWARKLQARSRVTQCRVLERKAAEFIAQFALRIGDVETAKLVVDSLPSKGAGAFQGCGDRSRVLRAGIDLAEGDLDAVREHVRSMQPDNPATFWAQEFWLEPGRQDGRREAAI